MKKQYQVTRTLTYRVTVEAESEKDALAQAKRLAESEWQHEETDYDVEELEE